MSHLVFGVILFSCFGVVLAEVDCSLYSTGESGVEICNLPDVIYCYYPYKCCTGVQNGCCFDGSGSNWFTTVELLGIILNATAMFFVGILTLVICGATYCNDKEDTSRIFMSNRK